MNQSVTLNAMYLRKQFEFVILDDYLCQMKNGIKIEDSFHQHRQNDSLIHFPMFRIV